MTVEGSSRGLALAEIYDVALLDLDGVVYVGPAAVPHAAEALLAARQHGMRLAFVTNNAARTPETVAAHLRRLGVAADDSDVVTSAQAAARIVAGLVEPGASVLVVGGAGLDAALAEHGLQPVRSADDKPAAVVQGFAPEVSWALLTEGTFAVARGLPWVASNLDVSIPLPRGRAPGNGALVSVIRLVTGRDPVVAGKPELALHQEAVLRSGAGNPLVVGDRLDTDIEGAHRAGTDSLLVFTGVTRPIDAVTAPQGLRPTYLAADLRGLLAPAPEVHRQDGGWRCGSWLAAVDDRGVRLTGDGDSYDGLRALCAAAWAGPEPLSAALAEEGVRQLGL